MVHVSNSYGPETYGEAFADVYDEWYSEISDVAASTRALTELAQGGRVLELGVGTGRLALPLVDGGLDVVGVDASQAMLDRLARNDPAGRIHAVRSDIAVDLPPGPFEVVFVAYNTFFNLTTEAQQTNCLRLVRERLSRTGHFVLEAFVPRPDGPHRGIEGRPNGSGVVLNVTIRDPASQIVRGQQVQLDEDRVRLRPWQIRYATPAELDDMAKRVGLTRVARWADWEGSSFHDTSNRHVSVYSPR